MRFVTMTAESFQSRTQALIYVSLDDSADSFMAHHRTTVMVCLSPHNCGWNCCNNNKLYLHDYIEIW